MNRTQSVTYGWVGHDVYAIFVLVIFYARRISHFPRVNWFTRAHTNRVANVSISIVHRHDHDTTANEYLLHGFSARSAKNGTHTHTKTRKLSARRVSGWTVRRSRQERKRKLNFPWIQLAKNWARDYWLLVSVRSRPHNDVGSCTALALFNRAPFRCCGLISVLLLRLRWTWRTMSLLISSAAFLREREIASPSLTRYLWARVQTNWTWFNAPHVKLKNEVFEHNYIRQWLAAAQTQKRKNRIQSFCPKMNCAAFQEC